MRLDSGMRAPATTPGDIVAVLESILGRSLHVAPGELDLLPERDPEAFEVLRTIDGMAGRIQRSEPGTVL